MIQVATNPHPVSESITEELTRTDRRWDLFGPTFPCAEKERFGEWADGGKWRVCLGSSLILLVPLEVYDSPWRRTYGRVQPGLGAVEPTSQPAIEAETASAAESNAVRT